MRHLKRSARVAVMLVMLPAFTACSDNSNPQPTREPVPTGQATADSTPEPGPVEPTRRATPAATRESKTVEPTSQATEASTNAAVACLSGDDGRGFRDAEHFRAALDCVVADFNWPTGRVPDVEWFVSQFPDPANSRYEVGLEYNVVTAQNRCAWYMTWLDARKNGDTSLEAEALDMITNVIPNLSTVIPNFPSDILDPSVVRSEQEIAERAALGDPSLVQQFVTGNCELIVWKIDS